QDRSRFAGGTEGEYGQCGNGRARCLAVPLDGHFRRWYLGDERFHPAVTPGVASLRRQFPDAMEVLVRSLVRPGSGVLLVALCWVTRVAAQNGTIHGSVADSSGAPVANATVSIEDAGLRASTSGDGTY